MTEMSAAEPGVTLEDLLESLASKQAQIDALEVQIRSGAVAAYKAGATWDDIAHCLGLNSRSAAHKRFSRFIKKGKSD